MCDGCWIKVVLFAHDEVKYEKRLLIHDPLCKEI